jgi:hypothetical protein
MFAALGVAFGITPAETGEVLGSLATLYFGLTLWLVLLTAVWRSLLERRRSGLVVLLV